MSGLKAVLLAGGEGTRLRPISAEQPKPLARILGKPIMAYSLELLARHGFTDVRATLRTLPQKIIDAFGDGADYGVRLSYSVENQPLGTAGAVRACAEHVAGCGAFAVLSGDAVTDFDLSEALHLHHGMAADATILLSRQPEPLEYGLVMTDACGRVRRFIEKPSWEQVFSNLVNTGIYILSPRVLELVPEDTEFDFARGLFPKMLERGMALYAAEARGYWCDVGGPGAYMRCCADLLDGKARLTLPPRAETVPPGVELRPPVFIGLGCEIGAGTVLGPYAMLSAGTRVGRRARIERSVLDGARAGDLVSLEGAYV
ncbi:MAG: NDP-sugar synthase, partial [Oscillospiraceae bacterium]|nr:NDP-sugar synthase [Oscillospiraceae bacterium]